MANMHEVAQSTAEHAAVLFHIQLDLIEIAKEFDRSEPYLDGEGDAIREVHGAIRLAARRLKELHEQYARYAEARGLAGHDVLTSPQVIAPRSPATPAH